MISVTIRHFLDGKEVPAAQWGNQLTRSFLRGWAEKVAEHLERVRCPVHHQSATAVQILAGEHGKLKFEITGCCARLVEASQQKLREL